MSGTCAGVAGVWGGFELWCLECKVRGLHLPGAQSEARASLTSDDACAVCLNTGLCRGLDGEWPKGKWRNLNPKR